MNLVTLQNEIADDEGVKYETYNCSLGHLTGGIGHLITEWDTEYYDKPIGTKIPNEQVNEWFENDIQVSIKDCQGIFSNFESLPENIQHVLVNMSFQLGKPRLSKFKKMIAAVEDMNWEKMADEMQDSTWRWQTPNRAQRLIKRAEDQMIKDIPV
jgi:lysozyme